MPVDQTPTRDLVDAAGKDSFPASDPPPSTPGPASPTILHAARSETSSNSWKLSVMSEASLFAWVVGTRSKTS